MMIHTSTYCDTVRDQIQLIMYENHICSDDITYAETAYHCDFVLSDAHDSNTSCYI